MAAFIANVGVNASHVARSPLFDDGTFRLLPIPEAVAWRPPMLRLCDRSDLVRHAPAGWRARPVHLDPDLESATPTYGDNCRRAGRAFSLRRAGRGDVIVFVARLVPRNAPPSFHLVGALDIDDVLVDVTSDPGPGWWDSNAHVRRARASANWDSFWVFKGGVRSRLFSQAQPFGKHEAACVFGDVWRWRDTRSELQTIASYTRAVRRVDGEGEQWLRNLCRT